MDDLSFKAICRLLKQHDPKLLDAVDAILGPAIVLGGLAGAAAGVPASLAIAGSLLGPKTALGAAGKKLFDHVAKGKYRGPLDRFQRMQIAYSLLTYTAFFDAVDDFFPILHKAFKLDAGKKLSLAKSAAATCDTETLPLLLPSATRLRTSGGDLEGAAGVVDNEVPLPHPAEGSEAQKGRLLRIYQDLTRGYQRFLQCSAAWESADQESRQKLEAKVATLPETAIANYEAQYVDLARQFPEFFIWASKEQYADHSTRIEKLSASWKRQIELVQATADRIDLGFKEIGKVLQLIPAAVAGLKPVATIQELLRHYTAYIEQPVVEEKFPAAPGTEPLRFPKRSDAFVPQAFRVLRATGAERLEEEETWRNLPIRQDLGALILSYFASPYSYRYPLLILGDPGSGKSLLTHMLAARLVSPQFTPIRVELRALETDEVSHQIEEQVSKDTNGQRVSWPSLNNELKNVPAIVLLDGYDELLQASEKVYASYLSNVRQFQETERTLGRPPVRAVVTSRITLIDKTRVPPGTTVIRLEPFDKPRRDKWVDVWNRTNAEYFQNSKPAVLPFELRPDDRQIEELAQQPLLLLMLAIYDSQSNELRRNEGLDRTRLYDNLLRRFVKRELSKDLEFRNVDDKEQTTRIALALDRLGVVAMSMFNRRSLLIRSEELAKDLPFFGYERFAEARDGRTLPQAHLLLGSFFFVHESRSSSKGPSPDNPEIESAFQFLHNTFGEFLSARFLVERVIDQADTIIEHLSKPKSALKLAQGLANSDFLDKGWVASLIYAPLFSRPVVLEMVREWVPHRLMGTMATESLRTALDVIVDAELRCILDRSQFPTLITQPDHASFRQLPLLGHLAVYTNNLVVLHTTILNGEVVFNESAYSKQEGGASPWDRLTHIWRAWFGLEGLQGLTAILVTERGEDAVQLRLRERFTAPSPTEQLEKVRDVARALGDGVLAGLAALEALDPYRTEEAELQRIGKELARDRVDLRLEIMTRRVRAARSLSSTEELASMFNECLDLVRKFGRERPRKTIEMVRAVLEMTRVLWWQAAGRSILTEIVDWVREGSEDTALAALDLLVDEGIGDLPRHFAEELFERVRRRGPYNSRYAAALLGLAVRTGRWPIVRSLGEEILFRKHQEPRQMPDQGDFELPPFATVDHRLRSEIAVRLIQAAVAMPEDRWLSGRVHELWVSHVTPDVVALLPSYVAVKALLLLPLTMEADGARQWLERFFEVARERWAALDRPARVWRESGLTGSVAITAADLALKYDLPFAARVADSIVHIHPRHVLGSSEDFELGTGMRPFVFAGGVPEAESILRVVRHAHNKKQARIWMLDFVGEILFPAAGGPSNLATGALVELIETADELRIPLEKIGLDVDMVDLTLRNISERFGSLSARLHKVRGVGRKRRPSEDEGGSSPTQ